LDGLLLCEFESGSFDKSILLDGLFLWGYYILTSFLSRETAKEFPKENGLVATLKNQTILLL